MKVHETRRKTHRVSSLFHLLKLCHILYIIYIGLPLVNLVVKNLSASAADIREVGLVPGLGRSRGGGHGNPLQYCCLENSGTEEPGGVQSTVSQRVGHNRSNPAGIDARHF